jgi:hypothetical protein
MDTRVSAKPPLRLDAVWRRVVGMVVTVHGSGVSTTLASNIVIFNGASAAVTLATA